MCQLLDPLNIKKPNNIVPFPGKELCVISYPMVVNRALSEVRRVPLC